MYGMAKYRKRLTVPFLRYLIAKLGENALALVRVCKNGRQFVKFLFLTSNLQRLDEGGKLFYGKIKIFGTIWSSLLIIYRLVILKHLENN